MFGTLVDPVQFARLPMRLRRGAIRSFWQSQCEAGQSPDFGLRPLFRHVLRVSAEEAERLQREVAFQDLVVTTGWSSLRHIARPTFERDAAEVSILGGDVLASVARAGNPVLLAPLHMGAFALPLAHIMRNYFSDRPMLILRARADCSEEAQVMQRVSELGIDMRFLNVADKQAYLDAARFAREGAVIICFADLPGSHGSPQTVSLFGQSADLAMGLASLARVTGATVVPLAVYSSVSGDRVKIGSPFRSEETGPDERERVADLIARHIEESVLAEPEQWHMWPRFDEYRTRLPAGGPLRKERLSHPAR